jgi:HlyD family secretion protein
MIAGCDRKEAAKPVGDRDAVTALGRVVPGREVFSIAAPQGNRILRLSAKEGQTVKSGEVLAELESHTLNLAEREAARVALEETRARLIAETAYAEALIEQSQQAVRLAEAELSYEQGELKRMESLRVADAIAKHRLDAQKFKAENLELAARKAAAELRASQASLERTRSLVAVKSAEARLATTEAQLETTIIRAPIDGRILRVFTYPGERIGNDPIVQMGNTDDMHVIAEVHETDIRLIRLGQRATITSPALEKAIEGTVDEVGQLVYKNDVLDVDPRANRDARVVEVRIRLDQAGAVAALTNLEVYARIDLRSGGSDARQAKAK